MSSPSFIVIFVVAKKPNSLIVVAAESSLIRRTLGLWCLPTLDNILTLWTCRGSLQIANVLPGWTNGVKICVLGGAGGLPGSSLGLAGEPNIEAEGPMIAEDRPALILGSCAIGYAEVSKGCLLPVEDAFLSCLFLVLVCISTNASVARCDLYKQQHTALEVVER
jgi:hypothetical protein